MQVKIRKATKNDLQDIVDCFLSIDTDPNWNYQFPYRHEHWATHKKHVKESFEKFFDAANNTVKVFNIDIVESSETKTKKGVVSFAVWRLAYLEDAHEKEAHSTPLSDLDNRPDANPRHVKAVKETLAKEKRRYFDDVHGKDVVWLELIATRPDCQRRGFARSLCEWGMNVVTKEKIPLCVFSTDAGVALYDALRFEKLGLVVVNLEGEEEEVRITPMVLDRRERKGEGG